MLSRKNENLILKFVTSVNKSGIKKPWSHRDRFYVINNYITIIV